MKANHDTCHLLLSSEKSSHIQIASCTIKSSKAKETAGNQFWFKIEYSCWEYLSESKQKTQCSRKNSKLYGTA